MATTSTVHEHHEVCECGHCRCEHSMRFAECTVQLPLHRCPCIRYTWPGPGADLPADHKRGVPLARTPAKRGG
jgi:hypothetical protein